MLERKKCSHNVQRPIDIADNSAKRIGHCYLRSFVLVVQWNANFSNLQGKWKFVIVHKRQRQSQAVFPVSRAILTRRLQQLKSTVPQIPVNVILISVQMRTNNPERNVIRL